MIGPDRPLLLGSASPRRRQLLETMGLPLAVTSADIDESQASGEPVDAYLERIAGSKLRAVGASAEAASSGAILVADTAVVVDDRLLAKPGSEAEATSMLAALSGRTHEVKTRFALARPSASTAILFARTVSTRVTFRALSEREIAAYVATGEGRDKAGAYAIQGIGGFAVSRIEGSYSNVVGLPVCEVIEALVSHGLLAEFPLADRG